jgi:twitching motility protein PilT
MSEQGQQEPPLQSMGDISMSKSYPSPYQIGGSVDMRDLFRAAVERNASDLHLAATLPPILRIDGELVKSEFPPLSPEQVKLLIYSLLTDRQRVQFERDMELDLSISVQGIGRFRVNVHIQRGSVEAAFRLFPPRIRTIEELGLPPAVVELTRRPNGLVLVTGPAGVGKTTTLAAMIDLINNERRSVIVVIEDPIEYLHQHKLSIVKQREVNADTKSFAAALIHALRQDPNVIAVGEMRDLETISVALTAAETGHLVLGTLHTADAPQTVDRIIDVFPPSQQQQVQVQLADCLQGVICQQLLPRKDHSGRVLACEIMVSTPAVRHLIREHATEQLPTVLQTGSQYGMCTMDNSLKDLYSREIISYDSAIRRAKYPDDFARLAAQKTNGSRK